MKITFEGETLDDIIPQLYLFLGHLAPETAMGPAPEEAAPAPEPEPERAAPPPTDEPVKRGPGRPKKTVAEDPAPAPEPEPQPEPEAAPDFDAMRSKAITKLMEVYNKGGAHSAKVKSVLKEFGVAKFAEVPEEKLKDLLTRAVELESEAA